MSWIQSSQTDGDLAGFVEWYQEAKHSLRTEAEKIAAFMRAAGELRTAIASLPALRRRAAAVAASAAALPMVLAPAVLDRMRAATAGIQARQSALERSGAGLVADATELAGRVQAGAKGTGALLRSPAAELGELAGLWLVLGVGVAAAAATAAIVRYLALWEGHKRQLGLAEKLLEDIRAGRITVQQATAMLEASVPAASSPFAELGKAGGLIAAGIAVAFILPMFLGRGRA